MTHIAIHVFLLLVGLLLLVGGVIAGHPGSVVIGIVVSGINVQQWLWWRKRQHTD